MACPEHPRFTGKQAPRASKKHPQGCPKCWAIYERKTDGSAEEDDRVEGS